MHKLITIKPHTIIKLIAGAALSAIITCLAATVFFIYSNSGFYYLVNALSFYYDTKVTISASSGTLANGITIEQAAITGHNINVNLTGVTLKQSLPNILNIPQIRIEKMLLDFDSLNTTITDIKVIEGSNKNNNISFKIPKYNITSQTDLTKHDSEYAIVTNIGFTDRKLELIGITNKQSLHLKNNADSAINANVKVTWHDILSWNINANNKIITDNLQNLDFHSHGTQNDFIFSLNKLQGMLKAKPLNANLIYKKHHNLQSLLANITYSNSKAKIDFNMANNISLKADIDAPDLSEIMPELLGAITTKINIAGTLTKPEAKIILHAKNILKSNLSIDDLTTDLSFNENGSNNIAASIIASGARYKSIYKKQSSIHINGNLAKHTINIDSKSGINDTSFMSVIEGSYNYQANDQNWSAQIIKLALNDKYSNLTIAKPDNIRVSNNKVTNNQLCLANKEQLICTKFMLDTRNLSWQAQVQSDHFELNNLSPLNFLNDLITTTSGAVRGDMTLRSDKLGNISQHGSLSIKDAELYLKTQNIYPKISYLNINSNNHTSTITGEIISENKNKASIAGSIKTKNKFEANIKIKGENILMNNTQNIKLIASPNITLSLNNYLNILGKIDIPEAKFNIQDDNEVKLPNDIIISNYYDENKSNFMVLGPKTSLTINLLDDITIGMQKISSKIRGSILLNVNNDNQMLATGTIETYNGSFSAYGQKLDIARGKLIYDKDPLDSPWINIEATRSINLDSNDDIRSLENIIVGIIISGHISSPDITLFSNPNKYTENEILSLLLTGSLSSMINDDGTTDDNKPDNFYSMLLGKNFIQSLGVLNQLSDTLSLNQITIGGSINDNQTGISSKGPINITMSKNINDNLRLIGTFGIYSDDYSLSAIYNINKNIMLKGYTNQLSHGLNMLYKFNTT